MKIKVVHKNKTGKVKQGYSQTGSVFEAKDAIAPTLDGAAGRLFKVSIKKMKIKKKQYGKHQQDCVHDVSGISPPVCPGTHGSGPHLLKVIIDQKGDGMEKSKGSWKDKKKKPAVVDVGITTKKKKKKQEIQIADFRNDEGLRIRKGGNSPTLAASHTSDGNKDISMCPPLVMGTITEATGNRAGSSSEFLKSVENINNVSGQIRRLTPVECEKLQGFPPGWTAEGIDKDGNEVIMSDTQRYKTLGNAVTTNVIEALIDKMFFGEEYFNKKYNIKVLEIKNFW